MSISFSNKKVIVLLLSVIAALSLFLNVFGQSFSPPGFNADEAAFGYNAYSILKTGKDEYGNFLPLRLKSFGDYKMPLYSYLSVPFIAAFGLSEESTRALNILLSLLFPFVIFFLAKELFVRDDVSILASFLVATSLGLHIVGRQAHEAYLAAFLISLSLIFLIKLFKFWRLRDSVILFFLTLLSLFSYQSSRVFALFFVLFSVFYVFKNKGRKALVLSVILALTIFTLTDIIYKPERVANLLIINNSGFSLEVKQLEDEGGKFVFYNKLFIAARDVAFQHIEYYSPQFLAINGDENFRFGYPTMAPMSILEYLFIFVGLYFAFKNKEKWRYFLILLILVTPLSASLTWAGTSLTRSLFLLIPLLLLSAYGAVFFLKSFKKRNLYVVIIILLGIEAFFSFYSWDFYLNHYPKRALVDRDWQAGYRELATYIQSNYNKFSKFYITKKNGQPYIFLLFYSRYDPSRYQKEAVLSSPDQYGFGQVEGFDKYDFNFIIDQNQKNVALIGYPDDYENQNVDLSKIKKIMIGNEEIFWIYEK